MLACILNGILFGGVKLVYELTGGVFSGLLYCTFLGITVTLAVGAQFRQILAYLGSLTVGLLWVALYVGFENLLMCTQMQAVAAKVIAFGIVSFIIEAANLFMLRKGLCRYAALQFAVIVGVFSQKCTNIPLVIAALVIGVAVGITSKIIYAELLKSAE